MRGGWQRKKLIDFPREISLIRMVLLKCANAQTVVMKFIAFAGYEHKLAYQNCKMINTLSGLFVQTLIDFMLLQITINIEAGASKP